MQTQPEKRNTYKVADMFVFVDLESTGTSFEQDYLLEVGAIAVSPEWREVSRFHRVLSVDTRADIGTWDGWRTMHTKSGLIDECRSLRAETLTSADFAFAHWLQDLGFEYGQAIMAGHSIGVFDHPFTRRRLPIAAEFFSYRTMDFGAISRYLKSTYTNAGVTFPVKLASKDEFPHRSIPDCEIELAEARALTETLNRLIQA